MKSASSTDPYLNKTLYVTESDMLNNGTLLYNMLRQAPVGLLILRGPEYAVEFANEEYLKTIAFSYDEIINKPIFEIIPGAKERGFKEIVDAVYTTGKPCFINEREAILYHKGSHITGYLNLVYQPLKEQNGMVKGIMIMIHDVTELIMGRKKLEESEYRYKQLIEGLPVAVYTCNTNGYINLYNNAAVELWGREPVSGKDRWCGSDKIYRTDGSPLPLEECPMAIALREERAIEQDAIVIERPNGIRKHVLVSPKPLFDSSGTLCGAINTLVDITAIKQTELALRKSEQQKDDFIKMASHELKTPITSIKAYIQLLIRMSDPNQDSFLNTSLRTVDKQITKLTKLVSDLLDVAKIESDGLSLNKKVFNLNELTRKITSDMQTHLDQHTIVLNEAGEFMVCADTDRISQVIVNLLANAVKYSPKANNVIISIDPSGEDVVISIKDFGIGIAHEEQDRIFERFYRVQDKSEQIFQGFGIGLYIADDIIKRHGGKIWLVSEKDKGSVFSFSLPKK